MPRIVLATIGSLGDLHPFIAIGRALVDQGAQVTLAVPEDGVAKARAAGLDAAAILPSYASICARLGMTEAEVGARLIADTNFVIDQIIMPSLPVSTRALDEVATGADVLAGSIFALAAGIVAEKRRLPFAAVVLQPMTLFSTYDPPEAPRFEIMRHQPSTVIGRGWNAALYSLVRVVLRHRLSGKVDAVRAEHGLSPSRGAPFFDHGASTVATLCCWSRSLDPLPPDAPVDARLVGFPFFDSETGSAEPVAPDLARFMDAGDMPLVFTLGSVAVVAAGSFYDEARAAARMVGRRAIMLTGEPGPARIEDGCLSIGYAPHSAIFARAAAIVHHGGIGTTGQALRAGRPQIVVPHFGDQIDNAARLRRRGVAAIIDRRQFERSHAAQVIEDVLGDARMAEASRQAAEIIAREDGAADAARRIMLLVPASGAKPDPHLATVAE